MRSGAVGKAGFLHLGFARRGKRTILANLDYRIPCRAQRALYCDDAMPDLAHVFLITTTGCLLQGDRMALDIALGQGARAHVTTQSATKIHGMDANYAAQTQTIALADDAYLEFLPDPIIPHRRARFVSDTRISVAPSATLLYAEIIQPGRKHHHPEECFGAAVLSMALQVARPGGETLFTEKLLIEPQRHAMRQTGVMGPFDVFGNVLVCTPKDKADRIWQRTGAEVNLASGLAFGLLVYCIPFALLSDSDLVFTRALRLPTFEFEPYGSQPSTLLKRMAFVIRDGRIEKVFYPVFPPDRNAEDVTVWLRNNPM